MDDRFGLNKKDLSTPAKKPYAKQAVKMKRVMKEMKQKLRAANRRDIPERVEDLMAVFTQAYIAKVCKIDKSTVSRVLNAREKDGSPTYAEVSLLWADMRNYENLRGDSWDEKGQKRARMKRNAS